VVLCGWAQVWGGVEFGCGGLLLVLWVCVWVGVGGFGERGGGGTYGIV